MRKCKGFTLIELLLVVAIIALLISILLPSLRDAKEQAKIAKCLSNLRQMSVATFMYMDDNSGGFPFYVKEVGDNNAGLIESSHAGKTHGEFWRTFEGGVWWWEVQEKPLNEYLMGGRVDPDLKDTDGTIIKRTEIEPAHCPSDRVCHQRVWEMNNADATEISSYDEVGSSYYWNLQALSDTNLDQGSALWENHGAGWQRLGKRFVQDIAGGHVSTITFFVEDPFLYGLQSQVQTIGFHGKFSKHSAGFLDGHAAYIAADTRRWCGVGWAAINPNWVYRWPKIIPIYYEDISNKNCDP